MPARGPTDTASRRSPYRSNSDRVTTLPPNTPIEPVRVPGWATIRSAPMAMKYPPEAANSPIETTTGVPERRSATTSRNTVSEAR